MLIWECGWCYSQFSGLYRKAGKFTGQFIMKTEGTVYMTDVMQSDWAITVCIRPQGYLESWLGEKDRYELEHALQQLPLWQATSFSSNESNREHLSLSSRLERKIGANRVWNQIAVQIFWALYYWHCSPEHILKNYPLFQDRDQGWEMTDKGSQT